MAKAQRTAVSKPKATAAKAGERANGKSKPKSGGADGALGKEQKVHAF